MTKNTSNSAFRKIDIDQYNEDNFKDDEAELAVPTGPDEKEVSNFLNQGKFSDALKAVLSNAPLGSSNQQVKLLPFDYGTLKMNGEVMKKYIDIYHKSNLFAKKTKDLSCIAHEDFELSNNDSALALTLKVLLAIKSAQIEEAVANLTHDDVDILMKYIYRGFEYPSEGSSGHLLLWHEKAYSIGGAGSIVRVLSDRKRV